MRYFRSPHHQATAFALLLAVLMLLPGGAVPEVAGIDWADKVVHVVLFLVLTVLLTRSFRAVDRIRLPVVAAGALALVYSVLLELLQGVIPGRFLDLGDLLANGAGVLVAVLLQSAAKQG